MKNKKENKQLYFLVVVLIFYLSILLFNQKIFLSASVFFFTLMLKIIPAFIFVFILMTMSNYFITPEKVIKFSSKKGIKKWLFMVIAGLLSAGPPLVWYPLLAKLKNQGLSPGLIATYMYSKALVISFFPLLIFYFSLKYVVILYGKIGRAHV